MLLSIIIPVYNGERYIVECLHSVLDQWVPGVEVIVINDGSTDQTGTRIDAHFRGPLASGALRYHATVNGGVSAARNCGLAMACGDYLAFVDADDLVTADYLQKVLAATATGVDIVEFGYRTIGLNGSVLQPRLNSHQVVGHHSMKEVMPVVFASGIWYPFLRVIRRQLFEGIKFPEGVRFCEDVMTFSALYRGAKTLLVLPDVLYGYRINPEGATLNVRPDYAEKLIAFYRAILPDQSPANVALKVNVAYAARQCLSKSSDPWGRLPDDLESDLRWLLLRSPWLARAVRWRFLAYGVLGSMLYRLRYLVRGARRATAQAEAASAHGRRGEP